jgi:hypothetical protein
MSTGGPFRDLTERLEWPAVRRGIVTSNDRGLLSDRIRNALTDQIASGELPADDTGPRFPEKPDLGNPALCVIRRAEGE